MSKTHVVARPAPRFDREKNRSKIALVASLIIGLIGVIGLVGWATDNQLLKAFLPEQRPINPVAAVGLLDLALIFLAYYVKNVRLHRFFGVISIVIGVAALSPLPIDTLLFASKIAAAPGHTMIADTAAVCFILTGLAALLSASWRPIPRIIGNAGVAVILLLGVANMMGQIYAHDFIYSISGSFVMAFNLAFAFVVAAVSGILLVLRKHRMSGLHNISLLGWLIIAAIILLQIGGYLYWVQLRSKDISESTAAFTQQSEALKTSVDTRIDAYVGALHGYQGLYAASDFVSQKDFATYFTSLNLEKNYPGLRSIAYIANVPTAGIPAMVRDYRADTSMYPQGNPTYVIRTQAATPLHFYALYLSRYDELFTTYSGVDIAAIPGRYALYIDALDSKEPYASGTIRFLAEPGEPPVKGFFIVVPVVSAESEAPIGFVNANFSYDTFFGSLFGGPRGTDGLDVRVSDAGDTIYQTPGYTDGAAYHTKLMLPIAGRWWAMDVAAGSSYGVSGEQRRTQSSFLSSLLILSVMLALMFVLQARTRRRALGMANAMTADVQRERRNVVRAKEKDDAILRSIGDGLIAFDLHGRIDLNNTAAERMLGVGTGELRTRDFADFAAIHTLDGKLVPRDRRPYARVLRTGKPVSQKLSYVRADGTSFPAELNVSPIIRAGRITGAIEVFRDISADVQLDRAKSEFVSLASHQLRTPLSAINWYAEMLLNGDGGKLTDEQTAYVREIFEGNARMVELVNSLLDVSRLELGRMSFTPEPVDIVALARELEAEMRVTVETKKMKLTRLFDNDLPPVTTDRKMIRMVIQNLLSNALKYTPDAGRVSLVLARPSAADLEGTRLKVGGEYVLFAVRDSGLGIPEVQQKRIFEKMFRADNVRTLDVEGTGLGLYIVKEVVVRMGGWVGFESIEGKGTTFTVILPVMPPMKRS